MQILNVVPVHIVRATVARGKLVRVTVVRAKIVRVTVVRATIPAAAEFDRCAKLWL